MAKKFADSIFDAALNAVKNAATTLVFCSAEPANYAGIAAVALMTKTGLTAADYTGPADGDVSGRKLTVNAVSNMTPSANGTVTYAVLHDGATLLAGTSVTSQAVTTAQAWDSPAFVIGLTDPT
jgi:hypothetical protein